MCAPPAGAPKCSFIVSLCFFYRPQFSLPLPSLSFGVYVCLQPPRNTKMGHPVCARQTLDRETSPTPTPRETASFPLQKRVRNPRRLKFLFFFLFCCNFPHNISHTFPMDTHSHTSTHTHTHIYETFPPNTIIVVRRRARDEMMGMQVCCCWPVAAFHSGSDIY